MRRASRSLSAAFTPLSSLPSSAEEEQAMNDAQEDDLAAQWTEPVDATFPSDILVSAGPDDCSFFTDFDEFSGRDTLYAALQQQPLSCLPDLATLNDLDTTGIGKDAAASSYFPTSATAAVPDSHALLDAISPGGSGGGPHQRSGSAQLHNHRQHQTYYNKSNGNANFLLPHQAASQWLNECVRMADELERYIHIRLSAVDEVMRINKHSINKINNVLKFEEFTPSVSLLGLICLAMSHVVTLYEMAADALTTKANQPHGSLPLSTTAFQSFDHIERRPVIHFGNFCLDFEEHQAIQEQIFLRELQRCSSAASKLSARLGFDHADGGRLQSIYSTWQSDIIARVEKVQSIFKKED